MSGQSTSNIDPSATSQGWRHWLAPETIGESSEPIIRAPVIPWLLALVVICVTLYGARTWDQPIRGEESRWAQGANEMLRTGDWIVPRQQGQSFPERPPLNSWLMALASFVCGGMTPVAIRLPSVLAITITCLTLFLYSCRWLPNAGAFVIALVFASSGQVLQIGRLGESEAVLVACVTISLLGWHGLWLSGRPTLAWSVGFAAAGLAALTKGLQGPVYFIAVTSIYMFVQRQWLFWLRPSWWIGCGAMLLTIGLWLVPFWQATDAQAVKDIWTGLALDRMTLSGLVAHLLTYPLETLACLLPWSVFLVQLCKKEFRSELSRFRTPLLFAVVALAVTYPSVWLVTGARGRYFMPLYGVAALPLGLMVWQSLVAAAGSWAYNGWWRYAKVLTLIGAGVAIAIVASQSGLDSLARIRQTSVWGIISTVGCIAGVLILGALSVQSTRLKNASGQVGQTPLKLGMSAFVVSVLLVSWIYISFGINMDLRHGDHVRNNVQRLRERLAEPSALISFGPVHHRFEYHWQHSIAQKNWPENIDEAPPSLGHFCIDYHISDTPERRASGRGRTWTSTPGTLPFEWEEVARIPLEREYQDSSRWVIVGRPRRDRVGRLIAPKTEQQSSNVLR